MHIFRKFCKKFLDFRKFCPVQRIPSQNFLCIAGNFHHSDWHLLVRCCEQIRTSPDEGLTVLNISGAIKENESRRVQIDMCTLVTNPFCLTFVLQHTKYLQRLQNQLPTMSPIDQTWPPCAKMHSEAHKQLKVIFQKWRVGLRCYL